MPHLSSARDNSCIRVLIADDNADTRLLFHTFLSLLGFEVCTAAGGRDALRCAEHFKPDVVFLDVWMPDMDGMDTCLRLRAGPCPRPTPIFAVTADVERAEMFHQCFDRVLAKPVDLDCMAALVTERADQIRESSHKLH
jgi:CheY-like chemotaxis protein